MSFDPTQSKVIRILVKMNRPNSEQVTYFILIHPDSWVNQSGISIFKNNSSGFMCKWNIFNNKNKFLTILFDLLNLIIVNLPAIDIIAIWHQFKTPTSQRNWELQHSVYLTWKATFFLFCFLNSFLAVILLSSTLEPVIGNNKEKRTKSNITKKDKNPWKHLCVGFLEKLQRSDVLLTIMATFFHCFSCNPIPSLVKLIKTSTQYPREKIGWDYQVGRIRVRAIEGGDQKKSGREGHVIDRFAL